jgi:hypothetical protein
MISMRAAPAATPSTSPNARNANSPAVTVDVLLGRLHPAFDGTALRAG